MGLDPKDYKCPLEYFKQIQKEIDGVDVFEDENGNIHFACNSEEKVNQVTKLIDKHANYWSQISSD